uniref:NADH dehydrogenase [ubiquinone] 1 beta subcomplex subunit 9 n=1 Tax=Falco tinnunculus TaxID=100819 RepID=A0A8C4UVY5_FALTI
VAFLGATGPVPTHQWKVLKLHKKSLWNLSSWYILQSEEHRNEQHMVKAGQLLISAEEELIHGFRLPSSFFSPGGRSYKSCKCYRLPGWCLDHRHPSEKVAYPEFLSKKVQWTTRHF